MANLSVRITVELVQLGGKTRNGNGVRRLAKRVLLPFDAEAESFAAANSLQAVIHDMVQDHKQETRR